eukprot:6822451-Pyramimonas_sp.AAC.2
MYDPSGLPTKRQGIDEDFNTIGICKLDHGQVLPALLCTGADKSVGQNDKLGLATRANPPLGC